MTDDLKRDDLKKSVMELYTALSETVMLIEMLSAVPCSALDPAKYVLQNVRERHHENPEPPSD